MESPARFTRIAASSKSFAHSVSCFVVIFMSPSIDGECVGSGW
jgi:hypothetical protein